MRDIVNGIIAGAAGTAALNLTTYADMAWRGRAASGVPAQVIGSIAQRLGVKALSGDTDAGTADNRREAAGALSGYLVGLGVGGVYGGLAGKAPQPVLVAGPTLGLAAMAGSDVPIALTGVSDPRTWGLAGWLSDIVPHAVYGEVVAATYRRLTARG